LGVVLRVYIVDIDGTICTQNHFKNGERNYELAKPFLKRIKKINDLFDEGNEIHYWTARGSVSGLNHFDLTEKQLEEWGCKYTSLRVGDKPHYDLWIDDKAINSEKYFKNI
jgi:hypothetical protein